MAPKTIKAALAEMLDDLTEDNFHRFCHQLLDRRQEPRVRRNKVEGKRRWDIADVLVSTFTEAKSVGVAVEILEEMGCGDEAQELAKYNTEAGGAEAAAGASNTSSQDKHFVDKHRLELTNRVSNVGAILDELLDADVIQQEQYDEIHALPTSQAKMRALYSGPLRAAKACKDAFYKILEKNEPYLINDLKKNN
ncbi:apoptosis-associated speck-like protein containing a CARD isoform X2 [Betta splendens]|uniref:Apoptosis-associated speck-like protein containing a CARD isoform X2 n=1 Tax=Betta splendens TaxID=158456 RepID=A0A9W2XCQ8_BETSP|nr:apoptosis-associated speck-like protein containing a CARD isoform X2 [Betta splendens]